MIASGLLGALNAPAVLVFPLAVGFGSAFTHCAGMCGPIHLFLASRRPEAGLWRYHAGRVAGYAFLGLAAGWLGGVAAGLSSPAAKAASGWALASLYAFFGLQLLGLVP